MITTIKEWFDNLPIYLSDEKEHLGIVFHNKTEASYGFDRDANLEYCQQHNIPVYDLQRNGGVTVYTTGNITIGFIYNNHIRGGFILRKILVDLTNYLNSLGYKTILEGNDVLVEGYKVASACGYNFGKNYNWTYEGVQISINQDFEALKNICLKPMVKIPKGLSEYGITTVKMIEWCSSWIQNNLGLDIYD